MSSSKAISPSKEHEIMTGDPLDQVLRLIHEEHRYDNLPSKALNKLPYLVQKEALARDIDVTIPYFWYMFGVVAENTTTESPAASTQQAPSPVDDDLLRPVVKDILNQYYRTSLEDVTDKTYEDAPYEVQPAWRTLDKKIRTLHEDYNDFYEVDPSRDEIIDSIDQVYILFPVEEFPQHESALLDWYSILSRELYAPTLDVNRIMVANLAFWRSVSLSIAETHYHALRLNDIKRNLDISSFDSERQDSWNTLRQIERDALDEQFIGDRVRVPVDDRVCDAIVEPAVRAALEGQ